MKTLSEQDRILKLEEWARLARKALEKCADARGGDDGRWDAEDAILALDQLLPPEKQ